MSNTETQIKEAAKKLFFVEGHLHATTQEIADAAGVNRTLLNYYFRSRDELFNQVYLEARAEIHEKLRALLTVDLPFKEKVCNFIREFSKDLQKTPYSEAFMVTEINDCRKPLPHYKKGRESVIPSFLEEIKAEMEKGTIRKMHPLNFLMNIFALISHPILVRPLYQEILELSKDEFEKIACERNDLIIDMMFSKETNNRTK